jgi:hypothetical protein
MPPSRPTTCSGIVALFDPTLSLSGNSGAENKPPAAAPRSSRRPNHQHRSPVRRRGDDPRSETKSFLYFPVSKWRGQTNRYRRPHIEPAAWNSPVARRPARWARNREGSRKRTAPRGNPRARRLMARISAIAACSTLTYQRSSSWLWPPPPRLAANASALQYHPRLEAGRFKRRLFPDTDGR